MSNIKHIVAADDNNTFRSIYTYLQLKKRKRKENIRQNGLQGQPSVINNDHGKSTHASTP